LADNSDGNLTFEDRDVEVDGKPRRFLLARPRGAVTLDADRLERMRSGDFVSMIDMEILQAVATRGGEVAVVVFDAADAAGNPLWTFDPKLDDELRIELGRWLLKSQVALYRELIRMKSSGLVGVGFGKLELAGFQRGTVRVATDLASELESAEPARAAQIEIDLWLLEHAARWSGLALADYVASGLASDIAERDGKREQIEKLLADAAAAG